MYAQACICLCLHLSEGYASAAGPWVCRGCSLGGLKVQRRGVLDVQRTKRLRRGGLEAVFQTCPKRVRKASATKTGPRIKKSRRSVWGVRYFLVRIDKFSSVFDDFHGGAFSTAGAMDLHDFTKTPRLCTKFIFTAPVHKNERPIFKNGSETRVLSRRSAFSLRLCSKTECETKTVTGGTRGGRVLKQRFLGRRGGLQGG